jgi:hypothetical protein
MRFSPRLGSFALAALCCGGAGVAQNPIQENDIQFNNGTDVVFLYSDPSVGSSAGTGVVDLSGDLLWKSYPATALKSPVPIATPQMQLVGFDWAIYDTDWSTSATIYDVLISTGTVGTAAPLAGVITPNFADPNAVLLLGGPSGFPDPCTISPALCTAGGCPPVGYVNGYLVDASLAGPCDGSGLPAHILLAKDNHYCATQFVPGGMTFMSGPPGACGIGDYSIMDAHSTDETQFADPAVGPSNMNPYGGFQIGGPAAALGPEPSTEIAKYAFQFCEPTISIYVGSDPTEVSASLPGGLKFLTGDAGAQADVSGLGGTTIRYIVYDEDGLPVGTTLCFASSCIAPLLPNPGLNIMGAQVLLNVSDPTVFAALANGLVQLDNQGGVPFDNGIFQSAIRPLPASAGGIGLTLHSQGFPLRIATFALTQTQAFDTALR